ncbi:MAG: hypothetical protein ACXAC7_10710 [Candidatus Hodarchaeales archaeon]|jgi:hypothetical protein
MSKKRNFIPLHGKKSFNIKKISNSKKKQNYGTIKRTGILTVEESISSVKTSKKGRPRLLNGYAILIRTGKSMGEFTLSWLDEKNRNPNGYRPTLEEIYSLLWTNQKVFPNMFITSNRAETFNSVHDQQVSYRTRTTPQRANNKLSSWILYKYYPGGTKFFLTKEKWNIPMSILKKAFHLLIDATIIF